MTEEMSNFNKIKQQINTKEIPVCVVGIGRIGLPTALSFANFGFRTIGVDINDKLIEKINSNIFPLKDDEPGFDIIFDNVMKNKKFYATKNLHQAISGSKLIILSLPTPMDDKNVPDYSALVSVAQALNKTLTKGSIIVVESTVEPGFIEDKLIPIIEGNNNQLTAGKDFSIAACPETANPGEILNDFRKLPRIVGSIDNNTTDLISEIYHKVFNVEIIKMPNCRTANAVKLTTNVFRDVNIAFVNELALLFEKLDIDIIQVLQAAARKYNFQVHYPGAGVGGPCLPVNSYQLLNSADWANGSGLLKLVDVARKINEYMPSHVIELLSKSLKEKGLFGKEITVTILGVSYKPNVKDIQLSPAENIIKKLDSMNAKIKIYDPYFKSTTIFSHKTEENLIDAITNSDACILVTAHNEFLEIDPAFLTSKMKSPIIIDTRGVFDPHVAKKAGITYRGIGRGGV